MGPQLLLDKSALQSLSRDESWCVNRHYNLVYPPILFIEVLGDLKKVTGDLIRSKQIVSQIADKIRSIDSCFTAHYKILLTANLFGHEVTMDGRPILLGGTQITDSRGRSGIFFEEEPEREALRRWGTGEFSEAEHLLSDRWRQSTRSIDLEGWLRSQKKFARIQSFSELRVCALQICNFPKTQLENLRLIISEAGITEHDATQIFNLWLSRGMPPLRSYAPYAYYCSLVYVAFYLGLASHLIGTRSTNRIDLEYILYLPFCEVFSSNDNFHKQFAPLFLDERQDFVDGSDFKADMKKINDHWQSLSEDERTRLRKESGDYPPDWEDSITNKLWKKHMSPRSDYTPVETTPEREKEIMENIRPFLDAIEELDKRKK